MPRRLHVIAGDAKGIPLTAPRGARPTAGRVREALFSALGDVSGAAILDLYAGSGALAIEALSRGAARALLVDDDPAAKDACIANLAATHTEGRGRVVASRALTVLSKPAPSEAPFDLVLLDPPYAADDDELLAVLGALRGPGWLAPGARVVVERPARARELTPGELWKAEWRRKYGDTLVLVLREQG